MALIEDVMRSGFENYFALHIYNMQSSGSSHQSHRLKPETHYAVAVVARPKRPLCAVAKQVASVAKLVAFEVKYVELLTLVAVVAFV